MNSNRQILLFTNSFSLTNYLLKEWVRIIEESIKDHGRATIALSGGKTPVEFYTRLSQLESFKFWDKTHIFQVDERFVPSDDKENNFRTIRESLLTYVPIPRQNIHQIRTNFENVLVATEEYKNELVYFYDMKPHTFPCFDLVILGCGEDGHVASLHPGLKDIDDPRRLTVAVTDAYFKQERISLSLAVINHARHIIFLIQGERKADIVKRVLELNEDVPANKVEARTGTLTFMLDRRAASTLTLPPKLTDLGEAISFT